MSIMDRLKVVFSAWSKSARGQGPHTITVAARTPEGVERPSDEDLAARLEAVLYMLDPSATVRVGAQQIEGRPVQIETYAPQPLITKWLMPVDQSSPVQGMTFDYLR
jgi:hypothetical protein